MSSLSDHELREALKLNGIDVGPITDSTRSLYMAKLTKTTTELQIPFQDQQKKKREKKKVTQKIADEGNKMGVVSQNEEKVEMPCPVQIVHCLWTQLNNPGHIASDTIIMFPNGELFHVSRAILTSVCPKMINLFYNLKEIFPVKIASLNGSIHTVWVRDNETTLDLKEKISLTQSNITINEIRLVFNQTILTDNATLGDQGITQESVINFCLISEMSNSPYPLICNIQSLTHYFSISHLRLGMGMERAFPLCPTSGGLVTRVTLNSHVQHMLHVYDVPNAPFKMFLGFLYCGELPNMPDNSVQNDIDLILTCCVALGEAFQVSSFTIHCLYHLNKYLLKSNNSRLIERVLQYGETMRVSTTLKEHISLLN